MTVCYLKILDINDFYFVITSCQFKDFGPKGEVRARINIILEEREKCPYRMVQKWWKSGTK